MKRFILFGIIGSFLMTVSSISGYAFDDNHSEKIIVSDSYGVAHDIDVDVVFEVSTNKDALKFVQYDVSASFYGFDIAFVPELFVFLDDYDSIIYGIRNHRNARDCLRRIEHS